MTCAASRSGLLLLFLSVTACRPVPDATERDLRLDVQASLTSLGPLLMHGTELGDRLDEELWINWAERSEIPGGWAPPGIPPTRQRLRYRASTMVALERVGGAGRPQPGWEVVPRPQGHGDGLPDWTTEPAPAPGASHLSSVSNPATTSRACAIHDARSPQQVRRRWTQRTSSLGMPPGKSRDVVPTEYDVQAWLWDTPGQQARCVTLEVTETSDGVWATGGQAPRQDDQDRRR